MAKCKVLTGLEVKGLTSSCWNNYADKCIQKNDRHRSKYRKLWDKTWLPQTTNEKLYLFPMLKTLS